FRRINSASISARGMTGMCRARAVSTSTLSDLTAEEITTTSAPCTCTAACPWDTVAPCCCSRLVTSESARSEPLTVYPRFNRTSAIPLMPMPPMPTKWIRCVLRIISTLVFPLTPSFPSPGGRRRTQQLQTRRDNSISRLGLAQTAAVRCLLTQELRLPQQRLQHLVQPCAGEIGIKDDLRRPLLLQ